jgi:archaellum component FlaC
MAQQTTVLEDGFDRIQSALRSVEDEVQKVQKRIEKRSEKFSQDASDRVEKFRKEIRKYPAVKQVESLGNDLNKQIQDRSKQVEKQIESGIETVLGGLQIASRGEIGKLDKKLNRINRRLKALDKALAEASAASKPVQTKTQKPNATAAETVA